MNIVDFSKHFTTNQFDDFKDLTPVLHVTYNCEHPNVSLVWSKQKFGIFGVSIYLYAALSEIS